jgi:polymorphic membrane protein
VAATIMETSLLGLGPAQAVRTATVRVPCSVPALVLAMASVSSGEELSLTPNCTYTLTQGLPAVSQDLVILGNGATLTRSYAPGIPAFVILSSDAGSLTVNRLSFRNGDGAITMDGGQLTVNGGTFTGNTAADGGAISEPEAQDGYNAPVVSNATFIANRATDSGGAIYDGNNPLNGVQVTNCTFSLNRAANFGGAIYDFSIDETVNGSIFLGNRAGNGGALFLDPAGLASMSGDVLKSNSATQEGGAIYTLFGLDIGNSKILDNRAGDMGGGIYIDPRNIFDLVTDTEFIGNSANDGGGIANQGFLELSDVVISRNNAREFGAGIYNDAFFEAANTLITRNVAVSDGGGVYNDVNNENYDTPQLTNTSVLNNKQGNCAPLGSVPGCVG